MTRKFSVQVHERGERNPLFVGAIDRPADAPMATPAPGIHQPHPPVIVLRPAWLDTPLPRIVPRLLTLLLILAPGIAFWTFIARLVCRVF